MRSLRRRQLRQQLMQIATADRLGLFEEVNITKTVGRGPECTHSDATPLADEIACRFDAEQRALVEGIESDGLRPALPSKLGALAQLAKLDGLDQPFKFSGDLSVQEKRDATDWSREELLVFLNATCDMVGGGDN